MTFFSESMLNRDTQLIWRLWAYPLLSVHINRVTIYIFIC